MYLQLFVIYFVSSIDQDNQKALEDDLNDISLSSIGLDFVSLDDDEWTYEGLKRMVAWPCLMIQTKSLIWLKKENNRAIIHFKAQST